jgi:hypothetical protein
VRIFRIRLFAMPTIRIIRLSGGGKPLRQDGWSSFGAWSPPPPSLTNTPRLAIEFLDRWPPMIEIDRATSHRLQYSHRKLHKV